MTEERVKEVERSAEEIVQEFIKAAEGLPSKRETYYSHELYNIMRPDGEPSPAGELREFRKLFLQITPGSDEGGNLRVEVARWAR